MAETSNDSTNGAVGEEPAGKAKATPASTKGTQRDSAGGGKDAGHCRGRCECGRRRFVWASLFGCIGVGVLGTVRFFYPRALFEPRNRFAIGYPSDYAFGVNTRYQQSDRIWVVRDSSSIYVIFARCSHLGCTPDWKSAENKFKCPCHGSGFDVEGINFEGPAPGPLERVAVELDAEGRLVVDKSRLYGARQWKDPGAFVAV